MKHVLVLICLSLTLSAPAAALCVDEPLCAQPCPATNHCTTSEQCGPDRVCAAGCLPSQCFCQAGNWICTEDCNGQCELATSIVFENSDRLTWGGAAPFEAWNLYRGDLEFLRLTGQYTQVPGANPSAMRICGRTLGWLDDPDRPGAGRVTIYLVSGISAGIEGTLGVDGFGQSRPNANPCGSLDEETLCVTSGGTWDPISCGHYPCGQFPDCDAVIPGCDCGAGRNFANGTGCVMDPLCP